MGEVILSNPSFTGKRWRTVTFAHCGRYASISHLFMHSWQYSITNLSDQMRSSCKEPEGLMLMYEGVDDIIGIDNLRRSMANTDDATKACTSFKKEQRQTYQANTY